MTADISLVIDVGGGKQIVRPPRQTDAIGSVLRRTFDVACPLPADMLRLLARLMPKRPRGR